MKTLSTLTMLLLLVSLSDAQDLTLPKGNSNIYLQSGKAIKAVSLWRIDSVLVEYIIKGNLADVKTVDVSKIEALNFLIEFDERKHIVKKGYDLIILYPEDTLRGFIQEMDSETISYLPIGNEKMKRVKKDDIKSYIQWNAAGRGLPDNSVMGKKDLRLISYQAIGIEDASMKNQDSIFAESDYNPLSENAEKKDLKGEKMDALYYHQSYDRGVNDGFKGHKEDNWDSPFLSIDRVNAKVKQVNVPFGLDEKSYRDGYENEIVKRKAKRATTSGTIAKVIIFIIILSAL